VAVLAGPISRSILEDSRNYFVFNADGALDVVDGARSRQTKCHRVLVAIESHQGAVHMRVTTIGLDIAKNVFQVHGIDAAEKVVVRKQLRRHQVLEFFKALPPCLVGMEACASAHYWARELTQLSHRVRLMPAKDVKAYVKRNKNDAADAEAICEGVRRPTMRFVQIKSVEQQGRLMPHRARDLLMRQRTQLINALRAHMAELGIVAAQGREGVKELLKIIASEQDARLPVDAHASLVVLAAGLQAVQTMIGSIERRIIAQHRSDEASKRLRSIPGIGILGATAIAATVPDPNVFRSGRDFAAWIGMVPRQDSTGGKQKLGPISKQGDQYLRRILVVGAHAVLKRARHQPEKYPWVTRLLSRKPFRVVAVALASTTLADLFTPRLCTDPLSAVRATLRWQSSYELEDGVTHSWQAWLRRRSVDSFFPASLF
jgi:transposase